MIELENTYELCLDLGDGRWADPIEAVSFTYDVVAAKLPGHWILRGVKQWSTPKAIANAMMPYTALFPIDDIEWTFGQYKVPVYLADLTGVRSPYVSGLYLFRLKPGDETYREEHRAYTEIEKLEGW